MRYEHLKCEAEQKGNVSLASRRQLEENMSVIDHQPGEQHNDYFISQAASYPWYQRQTHWKISIPFSSKPISLILLMLLGDLGIVQSHFQYSSSHCCQGHGHTSHCCLPSITHCFLVVCWQAEEDGDLLWRLRASWTTSSSAESLVLFSWHLFFFLVCPFAFSEFSPLSHKWSSPKRGRLLCFYWCLFFSLFMMKSEVCLLSCSFDG